VSSHCAAVILAATILTQPALMRPAEATVAPSRSSRELTLWYPRPASQWLESLPIGNGWLGGMIFGATVRSILGNPCTIRYSNHVTQFNTTGDAVYSLNDALNVALQ
jgi:hypothetical protein